MENYDFDYLFETKKSEKEEAREKRSRAVESTIMGAILLAITLASFFFV